MNGTRRQIASTNQHPVSMGCRPYHTARVGWFIDGKCVRNGPQMTSKLPHVLHDLADRVVPAFQMLAALVRCEMAADEANTGTALVLSRALWWLVVAVWLVAAVFEVGVAVAVAVGLMGGVGWCHRGWRPREKVEY